MNGRGDIESMRHTHRVRTMRNTRPRRDDHRVSYHKATR